MRLAVVLVLLMSVLSVRVTLAGPPSHRQVRQALTVARLAADNQLPNLSLKAVAEALRNGPPADAIVPEVTLVFRSARVDTSAATRDRAVDPVTEIHDSVVQLLQRWRTENYDAVAIYETLASVVLPESSSVGVAAYVRPANVNPQLPNRLPDSSSLAQQLVIAAKQADRLEDLQTRLNRPELQNSVEARLLAALVAVQQSDTSTLTQQLNSARNRLTQGSTSATAQLAAVTAIAALRQADLNNFQDQASGSPGSGGTQTTGRDVADSVSRAAAALLQEASQLVQRLNAASGSAAESPARAYLLTAADALFASDQQQAALVTLADYLAVQVPSVYSNSEHDGYLRWRQKAVATQLYRRGLVAEARQLLQDYAAEFESRYRQGTLPTADSQMLASAAVAPTPDPAANSGISVSEHQSSVRIQQATADTDANKAAIWLMQHDVSAETSQRLFELPDLTSVSHAVVSPTGRQIALAATVAGQTAVSDSRLLIIDLETGAVRNLGPGTQPSWSPRGQRLTFSRYTPARGVWLIRGDGTDLQLLDEQGWGSRWSPDGRMIAYTRQSDGQAAIVVHDLVEEEFFRTSLSGEVSSALVTSSLQWVPGSQRISFRLKDGSATDGGSRIVSVPVLDQSGLVQHLKGESAAEISDFDWHPNGTRLVLAVSSSQTRGQQLFTMTTGEQEAWERLPGQPDDRRNLAASWTADGRTLYYVSRP